jgi:hypothetical protein
MKNSPSLADIILTLLIGCLLPVYAYARAMSIFFGFGGSDRGPAVVMLAVPSLVWLAEAWIKRNEQQISLGEVALLLAAQLALAVVVAAIIALALKKKIRRNRGD